MMSCQGVPARQLGTDGRQRAVRQARVEHGGPELPRRHRRRRHCRWQAAVPRVSRRTALSVPLASPGAVRLRLHGDHHHAEHHLQQLARPAVPISVYLTL